MFMVLAYWATVLLRLIIATTAILTTSHLIGVVRSIDFHRRNACEVLVKQIDNLESVLKDGNVKQ